MSSDKQYVLCGTRIYKSNIIVYYRKLRFKTVVYKSDTKKKTVFRFPCDLSIKSIL